MSDSVCLQASGLKEDLLCAVGERKVEMSSTVLFFFKVYFLLLLGP